MRIATLAVTGAALVSLGCSTTLGAKTKGYVSTGTDILEQVCKVPPQLINDVADAVIDVATVD